jgi:hypothetical protein
MRWYSTLGLCLCALVACRRGTESHRIDISHGSSAAQLTEAFDQAARLEPLSEGTDNQLRVWMAPFLGSDVTGYAITATGALACSADYRNDGLTVSVERAHCSSTEMAMGKRRLCKDPDSLLAGQLAELIFSSPRQAQGGLPTRASLGGIRPQVGIAAAQDHYRH